MADLDQTLTMALKGYAWLPDLRRRVGGGPALTRVMGQRAVGICGPAAARFFYGAGNLERHTALPELVVPAGTLVLLDVFGQNHDARLWTDPYRFDSDRFVDREIGEFDLIPQGGGDPRTGHRCPGERITVAVLGTLVRRLADLDHYLPPQRADIDLSRIPVLPRDRILMVVPEHRDAAVPLSASRSPATGGS